MLSRGDAFWVALDAGHGTCRTVDARYEKQDSGRGAVDAQDSGRGAVDAGQGTLDNKAVRFRDST